VFGALTMADGFTRRGLIKAGGAGAAGLTLLGAAGCSDEDSSASGAPVKKKAAPAGALNVVVVVVDSLRTDHVYGKKARTEAMDAFAKQSLRFTQVRPEAMPTIPARRSIMMGRHIFPFRGWRPYKGLTPSPGWEPVGHEGKMWIELLREAGWTSGYVTDNPHLLADVHAGFRAKFDRVELIDGQVPLRKPASRQVSQEELYKHLPPSLRGSSAEPRMKAYLAANPPGRPEEQHLSARVFAAGADWVDWAQTRQPFAVVVDSFDAHEPWDVPTNIKDIYGAPEVSGVEPIQPFNTPAGRPADLNLSKALVRRMGQLYSGEVTLADRWFGHLLERLEKNGLVENTVVVLVSDHGVLLGEFGWVGKKYTELHEELTHVPLMIRDPKGRAAGRASRYFASTHDIGPTVLSMLGVEKRARMNGHDLSPLLDGKQPPKRPFYVSGYTDHVIAGDGRWHLIANNQGGDKRLYDKKVDPRERRNVVAQHPEQAARLWKAVRDVAGGQPPKFNL
jgi:arylsulfatase A-like enzyme